MPSILFQALIVQYTLKTLFQEVIPLGKHIWACPQNIIQGKSSVVSKFGGKIIATVIWNRYWVKQMLVAKLKKEFYFIKWNESSEFKEFRGNLNKQAQNNGLNASCCSVLIPSRNLSRSRIFLASGESNSCRFKTPLVIIIQLYYYHLWLWWKRPKTRSDQIENSWQWLYNRIISIYSTLICKSSYLIYINLLKVAWILAFVLEILK